MNFTKFMILMLAWLSPPKSARASTDAPCKGNKAVAILRELYRKAILWKYYRCHKSIIEVPAIKRYH